MTVPVTTKVSAASNDSFDPAPPFSRLPLWPHPPTLQRKSDLCIPSTGIARPQSQFPHSCISVSASDLYIPIIGPHILLQQNRQTDTGNMGIYKSLTDT
jgi:hypothetical protein